MTGWPLVGRESELGVLARCLEGRGAVVAGVAGVGKTRLAMEAEALAREAGRPVERLVATRSARGLPLAPFARFSSGAADDPLRVVREALTAGREPGRLLLSVDDGHLLDDASAALVLELCASGAASVLVTLRSREPAPDAVTALWKYELCERIELQPLAHPEVARLLASVLGAPVDNATVFALWEHSNGNVLHLREMVRGGLAEEALVLADGLWSWRGELRAPPRLVELLAARLDGLDADARLALALLALGEPLTWPQLLTLVPEDLAESLADDGMVDVASANASGGDGDGVGELTVRLAHPLFGDVVRQGLSEPARRRLLEELAEAVDPGVEPLRVASWSLDAGLPTPADVLLAASRACVFVDAPAGLRFARAALDDATVEAAALVAQHAMLSHRPAEGEEVLAALDGRTLTAPERAQVAVSRANILTWGLGRPDEAVAVLDTVGTRDLASHAVPMLVFAGRVDDAIDRSAAIQADADSTPAQRLRAAIGAVPALVAAGKPTTALALAGEVLPLVPESSNELPVALSQLGAGITLAQLLSGDLDAPEMLIRPSYDDGVIRNIPLLRGGAALRLGQIALWRGRPVTAVRLLREAVHALRQADAGLLAWAWDTLRMAAALVGHTEVGRADDDVPRFALFVTESHRADAAVAAASGELSAARAAALAGLAAAVEKGHLIQATVLAFDLARYGDTRAALPDCEGALAEMMRSGVAALAAQDGGALEAVADDFAARGYELFAAEMARAAARAYGTEGLRDHERRADARADRLAEACEGARTPLLDDRPAATRLTPREREIATLAARGVADIEIARRLGLSVRTVETHLHRCYTKLGVTGRQDLAAYVS